MPNILFSMYSWGKANINFYGLPYSRLDMNLKSRYAMLSLQMLSYITKNGNIIYTWNLDPLWFDTMSIYCNDWPQESFMSTRMVNYLFTFHHLQRLMLTQFYTRDIWITNRCRTCSASSKNKMNDLGKEMARLQNMQAWRCKRNLYIRYM